MTSILTKRALEALRGDREPPEGPTITVVLAPRHIGAITDRLRSVAPRVSRAIARAVEGQHAQCIEGDWLPEK